MAGQLNKSQKLALDFVISGHNCVILGAAGTGKSFLVKDIVMKCSGLGKKVALTCTTGIACSIYLDLDVTICKAQTIHQWAGIDDGRLSAKEIKNVILNTPKHSKTVECVKNTDLLIIDECSMLSRHNLECINEVCSIKNSKMLFGGIQVVLVGDFLQLPPVPNRLTDDPGEFCINSPVYEKVFTHNLKLNSFMRQSDQMLIKAINEVSKGSVCSETEDFLKSLHRQLPPESKPVKLFATNDRVNDLNRENISSAEGQLYEFIAKDSGNKKLLSRILAPPVLWLKVGAPIILLKNLSCKLFNGLMGRVYSVTNNVPTVDFPSVGLKIALEKVKFSVFSRTENRDVAVREQIPLMLAYALTVHKAQGMTLDSVEVDCRGIFKAGQLAVAIGRAKSVERLRVVNFNKSVCLTQADHLISLMETPTNKERLEDRSCCNSFKSEDRGKFLIDVGEHIEFGLHNDVDIAFDLDFEDDFNEVLEQ